MPFAGSSGKKHLVRRRRCRLSPRTRGLFIQGLWFLSPREALEALQAGGLLVDLRSEELAQMKAFAVPEWIHLPHPVARSLAATLPHDRLLVLADSSGVYTRAAAATLGDLGFDRIVCLNGGMLAWDQAGMPVATDAGALLHGDCACVLRRKGPPSPPPPAETP